MNTFTPWAKPATVGQIVETVEALATIPPGTTLVGSGLAFQAIELGEDLSWARHESDTRRTGFVMAGDHVNYEVGALAGSLPLRVVDLDPWWADSSDKRALQ